MNTGFVGHHDVQFKLLQICFACSFVMVNNLTLPYCQRREHTTGNSLYMYPSDMHEVVRVIDNSATKNCDGHDDYFNIHQYYYSSASIKNLIHF